MKILMFTWKSFGDSDITQAFESLGHTVTGVPFDKKNDDLRNDPKVVDRLADIVRQQNPDFVFTFNYFPVIAQACKKNDVKYVSWVYDSPVVLLYSYTIIYPTNYIFVFDSDTYLEFHDQGINTVYFLPMAANPDRLLAMRDWDTFGKSRWNNRTDIAFIGSMYTEKHDFYGRMTSISEYTRGYLEGIMAAQMQIYGANIVEKLLTQEVMDDMYKDLPMEPSADGVERKSWLFAQYVINRRITAIERENLLSAIGERYEYDLYTPDETLTLPGAVNHGPVDFYDMAPYVFKKAKININISLRSIVNGIPLRCFDIMGNGGLLFTNYQGDLEQFFVPGEDIVVFESKEDMLNKLDYYLDPDHEAERAQIAENGLEKIKQAHTYKHRAAQILDTIGV